jgi:hypothetical protein
VSKNRRDPYRHVPPGLTEEERREWWERQYRKFVWGPGDIVITKKGGPRKKPEGEDGKRDPWWET